MNIKDNKYIVDECLRMTLDIQKMKDKRDKLIQLSRKAGTEARSISQNISILEKERDDFILSIK